MRLLRAADRPAVPWKNGGGVTYDVAAFPPGAGLDGFEWRISTAVVAADGPFSRFEGVDRTLLVIDGEGLDLAVAGLPPARLDRGSPPFDFPGDAAAVATLRSGPITDLNIMTRRDAWRGEVERRTQGTTTTIVAQDACVILALGAARLQTCDGPAVLADRDALLLHAGEAATLEPTTEDEFVIVQLSRLRWPR
jgi:environmental stress-induced protein Ves